MTIARKITIAAAGAALAACGHLGDWMNGKETAAAPDPTTEICRSFEYSEEVCACATQRMREISVDADAYATLASYYLEETDPAGDFASRWERAVAEAPLEPEPDDRERFAGILNKDHRVAINDCGG